MAEQINIADLFSDDDATCSDYSEPMSPEILPQRARRPQAKISPTAARRDDGGSVDLANQIPRWCYEDGTGGRATTPIRTEDRSSTPRRSVGSQNQDGRSDSSVQDTLSEIKHLLTSLSNKVEQNESTLKELQQSRDQCYPR